MFAAKKEMAAYSIYLILGLGEIKYV